MATIAKFPGLDDYMNAEPNKAAGGVTPYAASPGRASTGAPAKTQAPKEGGGGVAGSNFVNFDRYLKANEGVSNRIAGEQKERVAQVGRTAQGALRNANEGFQAWANQAIGDPVAQADARLGNDYDAMPDTASGPGRHNTNFADSGTINNAFAYQGPAFMDLESYTGDGPGTYGYQDVLNANRDAQDAINTINTPANLQATLEQTYGMRPGQGIMDGALVGTVGSPGFHEVGQTYSQQRLDEDARNADRNSETWFSGQRQAAITKLEEAKKNFNAEEVARLEKLLKGLPDGMGGGMHFGSTPTPTREWLAQLTPEERKKLGAFYASPEAYTGQVDNSLRNQRRSEVRTVIGNSGPMSGWIFDNLPQIQGDAPIEYDPSNSKDAYMNQLMSTYGDYNEPEFRQSEISQPPPRTQTFATPEEEQAAINAGTYNPFR